MNSTAAPPPGGSSPYPAPPAPAPYGNAGQYVQPQKTDGVSIAALVTGIVGLGVIPLVLGIIGLGRTKNQQQRGRGFAIAGIVLGALSIVLWTTVIIVVVVIGGKARAELTKEAEGYLTQCEAGDMAACDSLVAFSGAKYQKAADTCGGTQPEGTLFMCAAREIEEESSAANEEQLDQLEQLEPTIIESDPVAESLFASEAEARAFLDSTIPATVKDELNNPEYWEEEVEKADSACTKGDMVFCDLLGFLIEPSDAHWSNSDTCGGKIPGGGRAMRCSV